MTVQATYRFARIPEWILFHPDLDAVTIRVYATLDRFDGRECIPSLATIAERVVKSEDTVRRSIRSLEAIGALVVESRSNGGRQTSNRYVLAGDKPISPGTHATLPLAPMPGTGVAPMPGEPEQEDLEQEEQTPLPPAGEGAIEHLNDVTFEIFWAAYPRKTGKPAARRAYMTATRRVELFPGVVMIGLMRWKGYWAEARTEDQFIPHPATWLNQERWNDPCPKVAPANDRSSRSMAAIQRLAEADSR